MRVYPFVYNNYYNRIYKKEETYLRYALEGKSLGEFEVNFNPNDGITTTQILSLTDAVSSMPDYLIACDTATNDIVSRWFVIETKRLRKGQYQLELHRDLMADFYEQIVNAKIFLEKGVCSVYNNLIFNAENFSVNQIKKREVPLKDQTASAWIVGYLSSPKQDSQDIVVEYGIKNPFVFGEYSSLDSFFSEANVKNAAVATNVKSYLTIYNYLNTIEYYYTFSKNLEDVKERVRTLTGAPLKFIYEDGPEILAKEFDKVLKEEMLAIYNNIPDYYATLEEFEGYEVSGEDNWGRYRATASWNGRVIKAGEKYYKLRTVKSNVEKRIEGVLATDYIVTLFQALDTKINTNITQTQITGSISDYIEFSSQIEKIEVVADEIDVATEVTLSFTFDNNRPKLEDAPYCMFCIPYGRMIYREGERTYVTSKENAMNIAASIFTYGDKNVYDIQLLPYCPIEEVRNRHSYDLTEYILRNPSIKLQSASQVILWCRTSTGTFDIDYSFEADTEDPIEFKVNDKARFIRLCSPNYNGIFEMSPYKNRGIDFINVDYTYKPFSPYIHLSPNFKGLYGSDFNDARGLICGGDFSIASTSDAWVNYEIQNKNYQNIFNRQIENMEVQHYFQRIGDIAGAVSGSMQGAASGFAISGGNPVTSIGAGVASAVAGAFDVYAKDQLRNEAIDFTKDQFSFGLDNIKALPNSLTRISSFNENNKIFPFVEEYDCTDEERQAFYEKMKYNGLQLNVITTIQNNMNTNNYNGDPGKAGSGMSYFKGKIIRIEGIDDDYHILNAIAGELNKGVFI